MRPGLSAGTAEGELEFYLNGGHTMKSIDLCNGWMILQDVHDLGEVSEIFSEDPGLSPSGPSISEWEPLPRLGHLQTLLSNQPYFGRELRTFNDI